MHIAPGVIALGDLSAVERILVNLLSNASKYTPSGSPLEIILEHGDGMAVLSVVDHGPGIPESERENVFGLFYRVVDQAARATRGVGIGLALARQLVEKLGGAISIAETPGGGASFRVTIPLIGAPLPTAPSPLTPAMDTS
jgi:two-component system OmpR family sensor kinase